MIKRFRGSLLLLTATVIWGSAFVSQSVAMEYMQPFSFQAIRCFLAFLVMLPIIFLGDAFRGKAADFFRLWASKSLWIAGILCGIPLFLACNLQQLALVDVDPGKSGFLTAMYIVFVPVIGIFRRQKPSVTVLFAIILAVIGLYFLSCFGVSSIQTGDLLLLGCALMFAVQINVVDRFAGRVDPLRLNAIQILVCTTLSAGVMLATEQPSLSAIRNCVPHLIHVGIFSMGFAYGMQILGQKDLKQTTAALIMSLESVFAALFGWLLLEKGMSETELLGSALLFAAVILSQIEVKLPKKKKSEIL